MTPVLDATTWCAHLQACGGIGECVSLGVDAEEICLCPPGYSQPYCEPTIEIPSITMVVPSTTTSTSLPSSPVTTALVSPTTIPSKIYELYLSKESTPKLDYSWMTFYPDQKHHIQEKIMFIPSIDSGNKFHENFQENHTTIEISSSDEIISQGWFEYSLHALDRLLVPILLVSLLVCLLIIIKYYLDERKVRLQMDQMVSDMENGQVNDQLDQICEDDKFVGGQDENFATENNTIIRNLLSMNHENICEDVVKKEDSDTAKELAGKDVAGIVKECAAKAGIVKECAAKTDIAKTEKDAMDGRKNTGSVIKSVIFRKTDNWMRMFGRGKTDETGQQAKKDEDVVPMFNSTPVEPMDPFIV